MGTRRNKQIEDTAPDAPGRVVVDSRGRNVWQWDESQLDSTTIMLQRLDNAELSLEPTRTTRKLRHLEPSGRPDRQSGGAPPAPAASDDTSSFELEGTFVFKTGGGFDPYNRS